MRLYTGPTTPFGRWVEVVAAEAGVALEREVIKVADADFLDAENPLRLIPTLVGTPHGTVFDSRVICRFLAGMGPRKGVVPASEDWTLETRLALITGIMDAVVARQGERSRSGSLRSEAALSIYERRIDLGIAKLEREIDAFAEHWPRLDAIAVAVLLEYIDFRVGGAWRAVSPRLAAWLALQSGRPVMVASRFPSP